MSKANPHEGTEIEEKLPLIKRRESAVEKLKIPPLDTSQPVIEKSGMNEVEEEGEMLFKNFLSSEIQKASFEDDVPLKKSPGYRNPIWAKTGRDLRIIADKFAKTEERNRVHQKAQKMNNDMSYKEFRDLLSELFSNGGITHVRIVVLFFFCSDVAIAALRAGKNLFEQFLTWSIEFIVGDICRWVQDNGGWKSVIIRPFNSLDGTILMVALTFGVLFLYQYFRKKPLD